jgi:hypothetical protein
LKSSGEQTGLLLGVIVSGIIVAVLAVFVGLTVWFRGCFWYETDPNGRKAEKEDTEYSSTSSDEIAEDDQSQRTGERVKKAPKTEAKSRKKNRWVPIWQRD